MASINFKTIQALSANSGNNCAYPGCVKPIFNDEHLLVGELAHIEAASVGGPRYNPFQNEKERHGYSNLFYLCHPHHREIDAEENLDKYSVACLVNMKEQHENKYLLDPYKLDAAHIYKITGEINKYWNEIKHLNSEEHVVPWLKIPINVDSSFEEMYEKSIEALDKYNNMWETLIPEEDKMKHWELFNIGKPNHTMIMKMLLLQMSIKFQEEFLKLNPNDVTSKRILNSKREELKFLATSAGFVD